MDAKCLELRKIGGEESGKLVCNPELVRKNCLMISLGVNNQINFEKHIQSLTNFKCQIIGVDSKLQDFTTSQEYAKIGGKLLFKKIAVNFPIVEIFSSKKNLIGRKMKIVEFLKIDIGGHEHFLLAPFLKQFQVCQIFLQIHGKPLEHFELIETIRKLGFKLFSFERSSKCVTCCDYSFVNEKCMFRYEVGNLE
ncbi:unnamed protein product [Caenorhabditis angaria]|uniref:Methyltransferase FkbM domain-containing protein n=1 Tax=Caenorhabditis angaria TaxID=860376 RepID=A0A9P1N717_9PELO|nr:unnamed protein product [Caenorhabditis angaria]